MAQQVGFADAIKVEALDAHTYRVNLDDKFTIGAVPNGGYTASCMLAAARTHLTSRNQPDTLTAHFEYPFKTNTGPAIVVIEDVKLSSTISTLHLTLWQDGLQQRAPWLTPNKSRRCVLAYSSHTNMSELSGISMPTGYQTTPAAELPPLPDLEALKTKGFDGTWTESRLPKAAAHMRSLRNWNFYIPQGEPAAPGVLDWWMRFADGASISQSALAYVIDSVPHNMHAYLAPPEMRKMLEIPSDEEVAAQAKKSKKKDGSSGGGGGSSVGLWMPTMLINMEVKAALPDEGAEWLAMRVTSKQVKNGVFDLEIMVRDLEGEIVALSHQVARIVSIERNTGKGAKPKSSL